MGILQQFHGSGHILEYDLAEELNHGIYVSNLVYDVAGELGMPEEQRQELAIAGMLHDIGKLKLTGYINGIEPLVVEEMKYVRMHSKLSYEILKERGYSHFILQSILYHHENYDGSGYPDNLSGVEIPLGARIIRVCDVFAALTTDRPYRKSFDMEAAIELMIDEVKNFDMKIFLAFQRVAHTVGLKYKTNITVQ
ncbi:MAG: HD domain-containing protein [Lachnospiraceae bacterium]|nr:HD domain-containing protein [Lachnospiraceae bacterium]